MPTVQVRQQLHYVWLDWRRRHDHQLTSNRSKTRTGRRVRRQPKPPTGLQGYVTLHSEFRNSDPSGSPLIQSHGKASGPPPRGESGTPLWTKRRKRHSRRPTRPDRAVSKRPPPPIKPRPEPTRAAGKERRKERRLLWRRFSRRFFSESSAQDGDREVGPPPPFVRAWAALKSLSQRLQRYKGLSST